MKALRSLSDWYRRLSRRERRVVVGGAGVGAAALAVVLVLLPFAGHWTAREAALATSREQWARLEALVANAERIRQARDEERARPLAQGTRLVTGSTPALAASNLQVLIQRYADESAVQLNRVDVVGEPKPDRAGLLAIPVQLSGQGDIYGLVDLLYRLQHGEKLLVIDEMTVTAGLQASAGTQYLTWSIRLHGPYLAGEGRS